MRKKTPSARKTMKAIDSISRRHSRALKSKMTAEEEAKFNAAIEAETAAACDKGRMRETAEMAAKRLRGARRGVPKEMRDHFAKALELIDAATKEFERV